MATMPALVDFSLAYANAQMDTLGITPVISFTTVSPPNGTGIVTAQSPSAGSTISGAVTLTVSGSLMINKQGPTVFSMPANLIEDIVGP